ncbi:hypothetical protein GIB67_028497, partial [Kingdonia uniflora]
MLAFSTTVTGEVAQGQKRIVEPLGGSGEKVAEVRSASVDDLKEVEDRANLEILQGKEGTNQMLQVKVKANLAETAEERDRLGRHLMLKGYSQEEGDVIKVDTYAEEEEEEAGLLKVIKKMSLRINDLESGLARELETSKALLSAQAE